MGHPLAYLTTGATHDTLDCVGFLIPFCVKFRFFGEFYDDRTIVAGMCDVA